VRLRRENVRVTDVEHDASESASERVPRLGLPLVAR
jgi:hypothetical protein